MKKVVIAIVLLVLIVAVSYLKTTREHDRAERYYTEGMTEAGQNLDQTVKEADSLRFELADQQLAFADSLVNKDMTHRNQVDSLENLVEQKEKTIVSLSTKKASTSTASVKKSPATKTLTKHEQILSYYRKRFAGLPKDLSEYERRIAINEIREETSQKFAISLTELKKIRDDSKLTY